MRLLVVDINFDYKNPVYRQFYTALLTCMEVHFFGPGYVARDCLEKGICRFIDENGQYDAILLGNYFVYSVGERAARHTAYSIHRRTLPYYKINDAYQCCRKIYEELKKIKDVIKIFSYYEDNCSMPEGDKVICQQLIDCGFYVLSWPIECMERYAGKIRRTHQVLTNHAYDLAENYSMQYIPITVLGMGYHEIFVRNFWDREFEWCIPGNKEVWFYPERNEAERVIEHERKRIWKDDPFQTLSVETINRKHINWYQFRNKSEKILSLFWGKDNNIASQPKMQYIAACREQYLESMRSSKLVYAESGIGNQMVRKYFEACACGAVLVAKRVPGISRMGFIHEKNCIIVEKYEDIMGIDSKYSIEQMIRIAKAGQQLILDKHMFVHRARALQDTLQIIGQGQYKGAYWFDGNYIMKK